MSKKQRRAENEIEYVDYLMWVGSFSYPTVDSYINEAKERGPCKRLGRVPRALLESLDSEIGKNQQARVFLAHDDGLVGDGFIFGYFEPNAVEYIYENEEDIPIELVDYVVWTPVSSLNGEESRDCGDREVGPYVIRFVDEPDFEGGLVIFDKPRILEAFDEGRTHFRGMLRIDYGSKVAGKVRKNKTMVPPSRQASEPVDRKTPWTDEENDTMNDLIEWVADGASLSRAAQEVAYETGRSKNAVIYRYRQLTKEE